MKFFIVLALAIVGATAAPSVGDSVIDDIQSAINTILGYLPEPLLDIHGTDRQIDLGFEQLDFTTYDIVLTGFNTLDVSSMTYDEDTGRLEYDWAFAELDLNVKFDLVLSGVLDAENSPVINIDLSDLRLTGYAVLDTAASPNQVTDLQLLVTLGSAKTELSGILNDDALTEKLQAVLDAQLPAIVNDIAVQVEPAVSPIIKSVVNILLRFFA